jgi:hypothetical protein
MLAVVPLVLAFAVPLPSISLPSRGFGAPRSMWNEMEAACGRGECARHSNSSTNIKNSTDCHGRLLTYDFALTVIPALAPMREAFDSLELAGCGVTPPVGRTPRRATKRRAAVGSSVYVDAAAGNDANPGSLTEPVATVEKALVLSRSAPSRPVTIVLRAGTHFLAKTVALTPEDSGLTIKAYPGEAATVSGGVPLSSANMGPWKRAADLGNDGAAGSPNVWKATLAPSVAPFIGLTTLAPHRRVTRARYPNADPEVQSLWNSGGLITKWTHSLECVGKSAVVYEDLRAACAPHGGGGGDDRGGDDRAAAARPCKNDSSMWDTYNTFANGHGGCCAAWAGDGSPYGPMGDYFCGNSSAGGWVGYQDIRGDDSTKGLSPMLPTGFIYNASQLPWLKNITSSGMEGALVHVWRAQGWFVTMYRVASHDAATATVTFGKRSDGVTDGGWQGGRGMQVTAAALKDPTQSYLVLGDWFIENAKALLDAPNEYYVEVSAADAALGAAGAAVLYYWPNGTASTKSGAPSRDVTLVATQLKTLISINASMGSPIRDVTIEGVTFRDAADVAMEPWGVPSGGDWGLHRGGAIFIEGCENCVVTECTFTRLDGNAVFLSGYTRGATVADSTFEWLGHSAVAAWGYTDEDDGTGGQQPRGSEIVRNYVREIGLIQKQSSAFFQAKSCENNISSNVYFNGPRAAINLNDGFGGGNTIHRNAIWNQCRETGDHGPINSCASSSRAQRTTPPFFARASSSCFLLRTTIASFTPYERAYSPLARPRIDHARRGPPAVSDDGGRWGDSVLRCRDDVSGPQLNRRQLRCVALPRPFPRRACTIAFSRAHARAPLAHARAHAHPLPTWSQARRKVSTRMMAPRGTTFITTLCGWRTGGRWTTEGTTRSSRTTLSTAETASRALTPSPSYPGTAWSGRATSAP